MKRSNKLSSMFKNSLVAVVVLVIGLASLAIYQDLKRNYITASDSTGTFTFEYPENWIIKPYVWEDCCEGSAQSEPDWTKETQPITLQLADDETVTITITAEKYGDYWDSLKALKASVREDYFAKVLFEGTRDDGHQALFARVDYLGPPDAKVESFTDHRYYFDYGNKVLRAEFREKYHHDWPDDETGPDIDNSKYLADFERIAESIYFSN